MLVCREVSVSAASIAQWKKGSADMGFAIKTGDTRAWTMTLEEDGDAVDLTNATLINCYVFQQGSTTEIMDSTASITGSTSGKISVTPATSAVESSGYFDLEVQVTFVDGTIATWPNAGFEELHITRELK